MRPVKIQPRARTVLGSCLVGCDMVVKGVKPDPVKDGVDNT